MVFTWKSEHEQFNRVWSTVDIHCLRLSSLCLAVMTNIVDTWIHCLSSSAYAPTVIVDQLVNITIQMTGRELLTINCSPHITWHAVDQSHLSNSLSYLIQVFKSMCRCVFSLVDRWLDYRSLGTCMWFKSRPLH